MKSLAASILCCCTTLRLNDRWVPGKVMVCVWGGEASVNCYNTLVIFRGHLGPRREVALESNLEMS